MKTRTFFTISLLFLISLMVFASSEKETIINLIGEDTSSGGPSRIPQAPAIEAYLTDNAIDIYFLNDIGNITISITSETDELIYQTTEPGNYGAIASIDLQSMPSGSYKISFTNDSGSLFLQGVFEW